MYDRPFSRRAAYLIVSASDDRVASIPGFTSNGQWLRVYVSVMRYNARVSSQ